MQKKGTPGWRTSLKNVFSLAYYDFVRKVDHTKDY